VEDEKERLDKFNGIGSFREASPIMEASKPPPLRITTTDLRHQNVSEKSRDPFELEGNIEPKLELKGPVRQTNVV
jgi:hypothetical protein